MGAYAAGKAALRHLTAVWGAELAAEEVRFLSIDPGDMDTPLHAAAVPDADRTTLKRPEHAAAAGLAKYADEIKLHLGRAHGVHGLSLAESTEPGAAQEKQIREQAIAQLRIAKQATTESVPDSWRWSYSLAQELARLASLEKDDNKVKELKKEGLTALKEIAERIPENKRGQFARLSKDLAN